MPETYTDGEILKGTRPRRDSMHSGNLQFKKPVEFTESLFPKLI